MKVVCIGCAEVISLEIEKEATTCPTCTTSINNDVYFKINTYSQYAIRYGHHYKEYYKSPQKSNNGSVIKPCLEDPTVLETFIAQAVVAGIVGNAAWAAITLTVNKIIDNFAEPNDLERIKNRIEPTFGEEQASIEKIIEDGLVRDILIFYSDDRNFTPEVEEEIVADSMMDPELQEKQFPRLEKIITIGSKNTTLSRKDRRLVDRERGKITETALKKIHNSKPTTLDCNTIWGRRNKKI